MKVLDMLPMHKIFYNILLFVFFFIILAFSIRGIYGNPTDETLNRPEFTERGPFELSPERGRFALTYSLIEDHSVKFSIPVARFATPDLGIKGNDYVSLFAPGVSFLVVPGYLIGKIFGLAQVGTYAVIAFFAILNAFLIRAIAIHLHANKIAATLASIIFLFATPAFAYAVNLYQHHSSTFLILLSIYFLLRWNNFWSLLAVWFLCATSISIDYPNLFFMFPIGVLSLTRVLIISKVKRNVSLNLNLINLMAFVGVIIPLFFFVWFNQASYNNPFQLSGTVTQVKELDKNGFPLEKAEIYKQLELEQAPQASTRKKEPLGFFKTRNILNGFYIHFVSPDRGVIYYAPVVLFGIIGFILALKKKVKIAPLLTAIVGANILLYAMWGDPYGGWAFGSRYLIPSYAILSIFIALLTTYWRKKVLFWAVFIFVSFYSIAVNALGAIATSAIPPKVEVLNLEKLSGVVQKYTYERSWDFLVSGHSKSFIYQAFAKDYLTSIQYYQIIVVLIFLVIGGHILYYMVFGKDKND